jgi:hypothetical protein
MLGATNVIQFTLQESADDKRVREVCIYFNFIDFFVSERLSLKGKDLLAAIKQNYTVLLKPINRNLN